MGPGTHDRGRKFSAAAESAGSRVRPEPLSEPVLFTALPGAILGPEFSPDGRQVAFFWGSPDKSKQGLYLKSLDFEKMSPLLLNPPNVQEFNYSPAWSPDGKTIAFLRRTSGNETWLFLISANGGPERQLIKLSSTPYYFASHKHLSWSLDSQWLLATMTNGKNIAIYRSTTWTGTGRKSPLTRHWRRRSSFDSLGDGTSA